MKSITYITLFIFLAGILMAQKNTDIHEKFEFKGDSEEKTFNFSVKDNAENLSFFVDGWVFRGKLKLEVFDPNGKREGGFELESSEIGSNTKVSVNSNSNSNSNSQGSGGTVTSSSSSSGSGSNSNSENSYSSKGTGKGGARGNMNKMLTKPIAGTWLVKISAIKTSGNLEVKITQD